MAPQDALVMSIGMGLLSFLIGLRVAGYRSAKRSLDVAHQALREWREKNTHLGVGDSPVALHLVDICLEALDQYIEILFDPKARVFFQDMREELIQLRSETTGPNDGGGQPLPRELLGAFVFWYILARP